MNQLSDIEIARATTGEPIQAIAEKIGAPDSALLPYGRDKAKLDLDWTKEVAGNKRGKLILVTAMTPTPAGEGKTTTTIGLGDGLRRDWQELTHLPARTKSWPMFWPKRRGCRGGYAQVIPMESINLHFTGDMHAISTAHNLLAAMLDNHIYWGNQLGLDARRIAWRQGRRHE